MTGRPTLQRMGTSLKQVVARSVAQAACPPPLTPCPIPAIRCSIPDTTVGFSQLFRWDNPLVATLKELIGKFDSDSHLRGRQFERICQGTVNLSRDGRERPRDVGVRTPWRHTEWWSKSAPSAQVDSTTSTSVASVPAGWTPAPPRTQGREDKFLSGNGMIYLCRDCLIVWIL